MATDIHDHTATGHESVASPGSNDGAPHAGTLGGGGGTTLEVVSDEVAEAASADESVLRDAYWAGVDETTGDVREVVIGADDRVQVTATDQYPWRAIASLLITARDGSSWIGTAWLASPRLLLTAGHCVFESSTGGWAHHIEVIPGRRGAARPFGSCISTSFRSVTGWTKRGDRDFDYGAILLPEGCRYGDRLGWFGWEARRDDDLEDKTINISGYPGDKPRGTQWFHANRVTEVSDRVITYEIDTAGGQSGAPVWVYTPRRGRIAVGIHTNGHHTGNSATRITDDVLARIRGWRDEVP